MSVDWQKASDPLDTDNPYRYGSENFRMWEKGHKDGFLYASNLAMRAERLKPDGKRLKN